MKKLLLLFGLAAIFSGIKGQTILFSDDFEAGYTDGLSISDVDAAWQYWGSGFTVPAKNVTGSGAGGDHWYARMERGGADNFAVVQRVFELTSGETYEYRIWVLPDAAGQKGAYKLEVIDIADNNTDVSGDVKLVGAGTDWEELVVTYTAAKTQNYGFRLTKTWGNQGASFDNVVFTCTTCTATDMKEPSLTDKIKIYPTPATDIINISATDVEIVEVTLLDLTGKTIYKSISAESISVSNLPKSLYVLKLKTSLGETVTKKVMLK
jgi:hypothetical protein